MCIRDRPQIIPVDQVESALFTSRNQFVRVEAGLIRQNQGSSRTQIQILLRERQLVVRREVVLHAKNVPVPSQLQHGVAVVISSRRPVIGAIRGGHINVAVLVQRRTASTLPERTARPIGSDQKSGFLLQRLRVVGKQPAVVGIFVATVSSESDIEDTVVVQQQRWTLHLKGRIKRSRAIPGRRRAGNDHRPSKTFVAGGDVQGMQTKVAHLVGCLSLIHI